MHTDTSDINSSFKKTFQLKPVQKTQLKTGPHGFDQSLDIYRRLNSKNAFVHFLTILTFLYILQDESQDYLLVLPF